MSKRPYGLICPISRAAELLEPRWTIQIITELWNGSTRFNDIRKALGNISSALLAKRLKDLEALGLVERLLDQSTGNVDYIRTAKAVSLEPAFHALAEWAQCNIEAEVALCNVDISTLMWSVRRKIDVHELPRRRTVIRFHFNDKPKPQYASYWLVTDPGSTLPELCAYDPGLDINLFVETNSMSLAAILNGRTTIAAETAKGELFLTGDAALGHTVGHWLRRNYYASLDGVLQLAN